MVNHLHRIVTNAAGESRIHNGVSALNGVTDRGTAAVKDASGKIGETLGKARSGIGGTDAWKKTAELAGKYRGPLIAGGAIIGSVVAIHAMRGHHREKVAAQERGRMIE